MSDNVIVFWGINLIYPLARSIIVVPYNTFASYDRKDESGAYIPITEYSCFFYLLTMKETCTRELIE